jgi:hypothetical protein
MFRIVAIFTVVSSMFIFELFEIAKAQQTVGVWSTDSKQDIDLFDTFNMKGDKLSFQCGNGGVSNGSAVVYIEIDKKLAPPKSTIKIVVDDTIESHLYTNEQGAADTGAQVMHGLFREVWNLARRGSTMKVFFSDGRKSIFSLKGSSKLLTEEPCGEAEGRSNPSLNEVTASEPDIDRKIRSLCQESWPSDYVMQKYCIDQQTKTATALGYK